MSKTIQLNMRIEATLADELLEIAHREGLRKTDVARRFIIDGLRAWRLDNAIEDYLDDRISMGRAAELAQVSLYEMMDELLRRGISLDRTDPAEARADLKRMIAELPGRYEVGGGA